MNLGMHHPIKMNRSKPGPYSPGYTVDSTFEVNPVYFGSLAAGFRTPTVPMVRISWCKLVTVRIKLPNEDISTFQMDPSDTVAQIKSMVIKDRGIPHYDHDYRLELSGNPLIESSKLHGKLFLARLVHH